MTTVETSYAVELGFNPGTHIIPDPDRPPLLRAGPRSAAPYAREGVEVHVCDAIDWAQDESFRPDLFEIGFDRLELAHHDALQRAFAAVRRAGRISDADAATIRTEVSGSVLRCASGRDLTVLHVADEGLIMRTAGPNRLSLVGERSVGMNDHGPATSVHADQDVHGTPLVQLLDGRAPSLFRHDSPDGHNRDASVMLVNLWIPLQQIVQPLVLGDGRSVDRLRHQLRYGLVTDSFLDRDDDQRINDIWSFLHAPDQRWYFRSEMDHRSAYVFDTLSTPHGAAVLPGEEVAERCYRSLEAAESAVELGDADALVEAVEATSSLAAPEQTTPALREAIGAMVALLEEACVDPGAVCTIGDEWSARSRAARRRVVRMSIELRLVVSSDS